MRGEEAINFQGHIATNIAIKPIKTIGFLLKNELSLAWPTITIGQNTHGNFNSTLPFRAKFFNFKRGELLNKYGLKEGEQMFYLHRLILAKLFCAVLISCAGEDGGGGKGGKFGKVSSQRYHRSIAFSCHPR